MTIFRPDNQGEKSQLNTSPTANLEEIYPKCRELLETSSWETLVFITANDQEAKELPDIAAEKAGDIPMPAFLPGLAQLELTLHQVRCSEDLVQEEINQPTVNPTLHVLELKWKNLASLIIPPEDNVEIEPEPGDEVLLVWRHPVTGNELIEHAAKEDLLILKMVIEEIGSKEIAVAANVPIGAIDRAYEIAVQKGLLIKPISLIQRDPPFISNDWAVTDQPDQTNIFTLQWHITQTCDLSCKHCYDRSDRSPLKLDQALKILDDLREFCKSRYVRGQVTFSGGNPLLYPHFNELYSAASERGLSVAFLGNPSPKARIEELTAIAHPVFYQVSLEGLQEHNDKIRGAGHFESTISFLKILKDLKIYSMVMLTLTKDNMQQIIPLAEKLRDLADHFTFNRLSMVGEGANLVLPTRDEYRVFTEEYLEYSKTNPTAGLKDNLINIVRYKKDMKTTGGCTGFGCGVAFNFLTLLPDGEVHACRKFPSIMGNAFETSLSDIYDSELASRYRRGSEACSSCAIRPSCGGCLASTYSHGLDIFTERDPYCFIEKQD